MAEYIEREAAIKLFNFAVLDCLGMEPTIRAGDIIKALESIPAADVVPMDFHERCLQIEIQKRMALERKRGKWRKILQNADGTSDYECSVCLGLIIDVPDDDEHPLYSFCPNCGADMREES